MIKPKGYRTGQTIFNFLEYLREKGYQTGQSSRMADPFHITDEVWDKEYAEFMKSLKPCRYFLSFVEEFWENINPKYKDFVVGRVEVYDDEHEYDIDEIRFFTNKKSWNRFREKWDFREVTKKQLDSLRKIIKDKYI